MVFLPEEIETEEIEKIRSYETELLWKSFGPLEEEDYVFRSSNVVPLFLDNLKVYSRHLLMSLQTRNSLTEQVGFLQ